MKYCVALVVSTFLIFGACEAQTFLTKDEALKLVFGSECAATHDPRPLTPELQSELEDKKFWYQYVEEDEKPESFHFFVCEKDGEKKYALIDSEVGKHLPITYIVGLKAQGEVTRVEMMVFRESQGSGVRDRSFMEQFEKKRPGETLKIGDGIQNVAGATYSSKSITRGVARALYLWQYFYGGKKN